MKKTDPETKAKNPIKDLSDYNYDRDKEKHKDREKEKEDKEKDKERDRDGEKRRFKERRDTTTGANNNIIVINNLSPRMNRNHSANSNVNSKDKSEGLYKPSSDGKERKQRSSREKTSSSTALAQEEIIYDSINFRATIFNSLYNNSETADIIFSFNDTDKTKYYGHYLIVSIWSSIWREQLKGASRENLKQVEVTKIKPRYFEDILRFCYCGEITLTSVSLKPLYSFSKEIKLGALSSRMRELLKDQVMQEPRVNNEQVISKERSFTISNDENGDSTSPVNGRRSRGSHLNNQNRLAASALSLSPRTSKKPDLTTTSPRRDTIAAVVSPKALRVRDREKDKEDLILRSNHLKRGNSIQKLKDLTSINSNDGVMNQSHKTGAKIFNVTASSVSSSMKDTSNTTTPLKETTALETAKFEAFGLSTSSKSTKQSLSDTNNSKSNTVNNNNTQGESNSMIPLSILSNREEKTPMTNTSPLSPTKQNGRALTASPHSARFMNDEGSGSSGWASEQQRKKKEKEEKKLRKSKEKEQKQKDKQKKNDAMKAQADLLKRIEMIESDHSKARKTAEKLETRGRPNSISPYEDDKTEDSSAQSQSKKSHTEQSQGN